MTKNILATRMGRTLAFSGAIVGTLAFTVMPHPAQARISTGAAIGIGLGSFALGSALGAASHPYYGYPYGYGYYAAPVYTPPVTVYTPPVTVYSPPATTYYDEYSYSYPTVTTYDYPYYGSSYGPDYEYGWGY